MKPIRQRYESINLVIKKLHGLHSTTKEMHQQVGELPAESVQKILNNLYDVRLLNDFLEMKELLANKGKVEQVKALYAAYNSLHQRQEDPALREIIQVLASIAEECGIEHVREEDLKLLALQVSRWHICEMIGRYVESDLYQLRVDLFPEYNLDLNSSTFNYKVMLADPRYFNILIENGFANCQHMSDYIYYFASKNFPDCNPMMMREGDDHSLCVVGAIAKGTDIEDYDFKDAVIFDPWKYDEAKPFLEVYPTSSAVRAVGLKLDLPPFPSVAQADLPPSAPLEPEIIVRSQALDSASLSDDYGIEMHEMVSKKLVLDMQGGASTHQEKDLMERSVLLNMQDETGYQEKEQDLLGIRIFSDLTVEEQGIIKKESRVIAVRESRYQSLCKNLEDSLQKKHNLELKREAAETKLEELRSRVKAIEADIRGVKKSTGFFSKKLESLRDLERKLGEVKKEKSAEKEMLKKTKKEIDKTFQESLHLKYLYRLSIEGFNRELEEFFESQGQIEEQGNRVLQLILESRKAKLSTFQVVDRALEVTKAIEGGSTLNNLAQKALNSPALDSALGIVGEVKSGGVLHKAAQQMVGSTTLDKALKLTSELESANKEHEDVQKRVRLAAKRQAKYLKSRAKKRTSKILCQFK